MYFVKNFPFLDFFLKRKIFFAVCQVLSPAQHAKSPKSGHCSARVFLVLFEKLPFVWSSNVETVANWTILTQDSGMHTRRPCWTHGVFRATWRVQGRWFDGVPGKVSLCWHYMHSYDSRTVFDLLMRSKQFAGRRIKDEANEDAGDRHRCVSSRANLITPMLA